MIALIKPKAGRWTDVWQDLARLANDKSNRIDLAITIEGWIAVYSQPTAPYSITQATML